MFSLYNWMLVSQWRCHTVTGRISRPAGHDWIKLLFRESHKIIYTVVNFPSFYGIWNNGLVIWPLTLVRSRGWSFVEDRAQARCPARRGGDGADVTCRWRDTAGPHNLYTAILKACLWLWWCRHFTLADQNLFLYTHVLKCFSRAGAGTLQPTIRAVKLIHYEDENPNLNILAGAGPSSAWAGSRPDCGIGAAICHRCHLNACYGDEWIWIISSNITSSIFRTQTASVPPCNHNNIYRS